MDNVVMKVEGDILTIQVDLRKRCGLSSSGKTMVVGTTRGNKHIDHGDSTYCVGVNVYTYRQ